MTANLDGTMIFLLKEGKLELGIRKALLNLGIPPEIRKGKHGADIIRNKIPKYIIEIKGNANNAGDEFASNTKDRTFFSVIGDICKRLRPKKEHYTYLLAIPEDRKYRNFVGKILEFRKRISLVIIWCKSYSEFDVECPNQQIMRFEEFCKLLKVRELEEVRNNFTLHAKKLGIRSEKDLLKTIARD